MKNIVISIALVAILVLGAAYRVDAAPQEQPSGQDQAAPNGENAEVSAEEQAKIDAVMVQIAAAIKSGDTKLVSKLLKKAVKANPKIAAKLVAAFISVAKTSGGAAGGGEAGATVAAIDVGAIVSDVASSMKGQAGGEALAAAVLGAIPPAAGDEAGAPVSDVGANPGEPGNPDTTTPPALPPTSNANVPSSVPVENPSQSSGN